MDDEISEPNYVDLTDLLDELLNGEGGPSDNAHLTDSYDNEEISEYESESSEELLEEEKDILTEEMGYEETKTETDTQVEEVVLIYFFIVRSVSEKGDLSFLRRMQIYEKTSQKTVVGIFWKILTKNCVFFGALQSQN